MAKYDINNPDDLIYVRGLFDTYSEEDWDNYIELAKEKKIGYKNVGILLEAKRKARLSKYFFDKKIIWALNLIEDLERSLEDDVKDEASKKLLQSKDINITPSNFTLRVAWHDNKWNGSICNNPEGNTYCNGFNSLLSERIRKRKDEGMEQEIKFKGQALQDIDYVPPCFWSVNLFGESSMQVQHDNPAAPTLINIDEEVPSKSILSWPFAVSFTRTKVEQSESGAYPKNLEEVRIPRFNAKIHEGKSIAFMYAKFSNPLTEEEQQYLVIGAGIITDKQKAQDIPHFGPKGEIDKIKERPKSNFKYRNFPSINWAMRFSFDDYSTVRMPYHEYLAQTENLNDELKDTFFDKIKVAITEPELEWCFKYVAMDIGDDEAIYILTKMRKSLISSKDDGIVPISKMEENIQKVDGLLQMAWEKRSYFPGFVSISRVLLSQTEEPKFPLEDFYDEIKEEIVDSNIEFKQIIENPLSNVISRKYTDELVELKDRLVQYGITLEELLKLSMLNLKPFQFNRIMNGKLKLNDTWIRNFDDDVKRSHKLRDIIANPYLLYEDYEYWSESHDNVYGEELDAPIDLFKIDIAYFPHTIYQKRIELQREMHFVDKRRIRALVLRHLKTLETNGDCFSSADKLQEAITSYPLYYELGEEYRIPSDFFYPLDADYVNHFQDDRNRMILVEANETMYYYLSEVYNAEKNIEGYFKILLNASDNPETFPELKKYINNSLNSLKNTITKDGDKVIFRDERDKLYTDIFAKKLFVVSGSAGSGKSYEILNILTHLEKNEGQQYLLLAPTGKAALRLSSDKDFNNIEASTIDKFIADVKNRKISNNTISQYKNIIIDECSMVDLLKLERLLKIFNFNAPSFKRLILIGDPNQLPAIGYGRILADTISYLKHNPSFHNNYIQLESNCRSELKENDVLLLAESFKQSVKEDLDTSLSKKFEQKVEQISEGFRVRYWSQKDELYASIKEEFEVLAAKENIIGNLNEKLNQLLGLSKDGTVVGKEIRIENFQILSPYQAQYSGTTKINDFIQANFKKDIKYELRKNTLKQSDKLIRTKNYYERQKLELSNGTLGLIRKDSSEKFIYESTNGLAQKPFHEIRKFEQEFFELAYAITVHKSQGSGFNHLFVVIPARYGLLSKELIYTALTRTKKSITIFIQSSPDQTKSVLEVAMGRSFSAARNTSLLLDKPYRFYDLEPENGVFVESRVELLIYHMLMLRRKQLGEEIFKFDYEVKPVIDGNEVNIKTDFTVYYNGKVWYWEHLGLLGQRKYTWIWQNLKKKRYQESGIWDKVITTDEFNGISTEKIEKIIDLIAEGKVTTEDKYNTYSNHHYYLR